MIETWLLGPFAAVAGAAVGSFVVTAALRTARAEQVLGGRSHCDNCGTTLSFARTAPVIGFIRARGRCWSCSAPIDPLHLVGEVAGALVGLAAVSLHDPWKTALVLTLGLVLIAAAATDARTLRLPNALTAAVAAICGLLALASSQEAFLIGLMAAGLSALVLAALRQLSRRRGADPGLGFGDVKLIAALALWLGALTPWMVLLAAILALAQVATGRPLGRRIAFGPAIAAAAMVVGYTKEIGLWPI